MSSKPTASGPASLNDSVRNSARKLIKPFALLHGDAAATADANANSHAEAEAEAEAEGDIDVHTEVFGR